MRAISALFLLAALSAQGQEDPLAQGIAAFNQGQFTAALASLEKAPDTPPRRVFLALTRAGLGHCDAAQSELAAQFDQNIDFQLRRLAGLALAQCRMTSGHYDEALPVLARLKSLYPADADVLYQTARLHMQAWNDTLFEMFQKTPGSFRVGGRRVPQGHRKESRGVKSALSPGPRAADRVTRAGEYGAGAASLRSGAGAESRRCRGGI
jgi:tetratricopeptide (TPR) repeat protein